MIEIKFDGRYLNSTGTPQAGETISACVLTGFRDEFDLGSATVETDGSYSIIFELGRVAVSTRDVRSTEGDGGDSSEMAEEELLDFLAEQCWVLKGTSTDLDGNVVETTRSNVVFGMALENRLDLITSNERYEGPTEYGRISSRIGPSVTLADGSVVPPEDLTAEDREYLAGHLDIYPLHLAMYVQAHRLAEGAASTAAVPPEAFFALGRSGLPMDLPSVLTRGTESVRGAIVSGFEGGVVPLTYITTPLPGEPTGAEVAAEQILAALDQVRLEASLAIPADLSKPSLGRIFAQSTLTMPQQELVVGAFGGERRPAAVVWAELRGHAGVGDAAVDEALFMLGAAAISRHHLPAYQELAGQRTSGAIADLRDLAAWTPAEWDAFVDLSGTPDAEDLPDDPVERAATYAKALRRIVEDAFPSAALSARLVTDFSSDTELQDVAVFLDAQQGFDILSTRLSRFEHDNSVTAPPQLSRVQRLYQIAPRLERYGAVKVMLEAGIESATDVVTKGRAATEGLLSSGLDGLEDVDGASAARGIVDKAISRYGVAWSILSSGSLGFHSAAPFVVPPPDTDLSDGGANPNPDAADLASLFGSQDYCACEHCSSVTSPAAYLADLLTFLSNLPRENGSGSALDVLSARRGDILKLELTCANSQTVLPYIDLVHELLEGLVTGEVVANQTEGNAEELRVLPEHQNDEAYPHLLGVGYPWTLPFSLPQAESSTYFKHLGISRAAFMEALEPLEAPVDQAYLNRKNAAYLDVNDVVFDILQNENPFSGKDYWNKTGTTWGNDLAQNVAEVLERADLELGELQEWLDTETVGRYVVDFGGSACDLSQAEIRESSAVSPALADNGVFRRLHRMVRAGRTLGLSVREVDGFIDGMGADVSVYADMARLRERFSVPFFEMLSWWEKIDRRESTVDDHQSHYRRTFLSEAVTLPGTTDDVFVLVNGEIPQGDDPNIDDSTIPRIAAALRTDQESIGYMRDKGLVGASLTVANLSKISRYSSLARALGVSVSELHRWELTLGAEAFGTGTERKPATTLDFLERLDAALSSQLSDVEFRFLVRSEFESEASPVPPDETIETLYDSVAGDFSQLVAGDGDGDGDLETLRQDLLVQHFGKEMSLSAAAARFLLFDALRVGTESLGDALVGHFVSGDQNANFDLYLRIFWASLPISRFSVTDAELDWFFKPRGALPAVLDLNSLPAVVSAPDEASPPSRAEALNRLRRELGLKKILISDGSGHREVFESIAGTEAELIAALTGWDSADVAALYQRFVASALSEKDRLSDPLTFERMAQSVSQARALGVTVESLASWADNSVDAVQSREITLAAKAKHSEASWLEVGAPLRDSIRDRQREALVDFILAGHPDDLDEASFGDEGDLFAHLLVDVQMTSCMMTTRTRLALSSVQTLVQRILLNLETESVGGNETVSVVMSRESAREWVWRKNYRVWEAARKVFLYPENFIEPELRDDKTPLFETLESFIFQGSATDARMTEAVQGYVRGLNSIARLSVLGIARDKRRDEVHFIARTPADPPVYYHRKRIGGADWTPWTSIESGIRGQNVLPMVVSGRLFVFWLEVAPASVTGGTFGPSFNARPAFRLGIGVTELEESGWSRPKIREPHVETTPDFPKLASHFLLRGQVVFGPSGRDQIQLSVLTAQEAGEASSLKALWRFDPVEGLFVLKRLAEADPSAYPTTIERGGSGNDGPRFQQYLKGNLNYQETSYSEPDGGGGGAGWGGGDDRVHLVTKNYYSGQLGATTLFEDAKEYTFATVEHGVPQSYSQAPTTLVNGTDSLLATRSDVFVSQLNAIQTDNFDLGDSDAVPWNFFAALGEPQESFAKASPTSLNLLANTLDSIETNLPWGGLSPGLGAEGGLAASLGPANPSFPAPGSILDLQAASDDVADLPTGPDGKLSGYAKFWAGHLFTLEQFGHPFAADLLLGMSEEGLAGVYKPSSNGPLADNLRQLRSIDFIEENYEPTLAVARPFPPRDFDFGIHSTNGVYNWELFFHVPFYVGDRLAGERRFAEALAWFQFVFDPTELPDGNAGVERFWNVKPFHLRQLDGNLGQKYQTQLVLGLVGTDEEQEEARRHYEWQVDAWMRDPFNPHALARLRPGVYERAIFVRYLRVLIEWGDELFRQDTIESINEAVQLYILAAELLGPRPQQLPRSEGVAKTFEDLIDEGLLGSLGDSLLDIESALVGAPVQSTIDTEVAGPVPPQPPPPLPGHFCHPANPQLLACWDLVEDRMFKIRNCLDLAGVRRDLPIYEPPIDPALLVLATANGVDLQSALNDLTAPLTPYRFQTVVGRAIEFTADVRSLGAQLLSAFEKRDAGELSRIRAGHDELVGQRVILARQQQVAEAESSIAALGVSRAVILDRIDEFSTREALNPAESDQRDKLQPVGGLLSQASASSLAASLLGIVPQFDLGTSGMGLHVVTGFGGQQLAAVANALAQGYSGEASKGQAEASSAGLRGGELRRKEEFEHQLAQAEAELAAIDAQIVGAKIRREVANNELAVAAQQRLNASEVEVFLREKYSNDELYVWMQQQVSALYFQSYQLAYDMAKKAERIYQRELGLVDGSTSFIQFGYWDALHDGLLAGERLNLSLKRLQSAYTENNVRELELTKRIPLSHIDPAALVELRETGECAFSIPEVVYDLDHPGHYFRRVKAVSLSIPAVVGPYTSVGATLRHTGSSLRAEKSTSAAALIVAEPVVDVMATSSSSNDAGVFELNFRDERFLPFEGAGAISSWRLQLPRELRQFDYETITDVVISVSYTARDGGDDFRGSVEDNLRSELNSILSGNGLGRIFSAKHEFPNEWNAFVNPGDETATTITLDLPIEQARFPFLGQLPQGLTATQVTLVAVPTRGTVFAPEVSPPPPVTPSPVVVLSGVASGLLEASGSGPVALTANAATTDDPADVYASSGAIVPANASIGQVAATSFVVNADDIDDVIGVSPVGAPKRIDPDKLEDILVLVHYQLDA